MPRRRSRFVRIIVDRGDDDRHRAVRRAGRERVHERWEATHHPRPQGQVRPGHPEPHPPGVRHRRRGVRPGHGRACCSSAGSSASKDDDDPEEFPEQVHGRTVLEIGWTILPALILAGVAVGTVITILEINKEPEDAIHVEVTGQQWWWQYKYDVNNDGNFDGPEDITTATEMVIPAGRNDRPHHRLQRRHPLVLDPGPERQEGRRSRHHQPAQHAGRRSRHLPGSVHRVLRALPRQHADARAGAAHRGLRRVGEEPAQGPRRPAGWARTPRRAARSGKSLCAQCHVINGINDDKLEENPPPLVSGVAPNLTHLMTRGTFAGSIFNLYSDVQSTYPGSNGQDLGTDPSDTAAAGNPGAALTGGRVDTDNVNRVALEAWLRNPPALKPMYAQGGRGHAEPGPDRSSDRPTGRLPRDAELIR